MVIFCIVNTYRAITNSEYEKRLSLYKEPIWTCQCTGATKLTHREAMESERKAHLQLASSFPVVFEKPVLELVHLSTYRRILDLMHVNCSLFMAYSIPI